MRALRASVIIIWSAFAVIAQTAEVARAAEAVDVALVLAADVSRSINDEEFGLQRQGYATALTSPRVLNAIHSGVHGSIAVAFVEVGWLC